MQHHDPFFNEFNNVCPEKVISSISDKCVQLLWENEPWCMYFSQTVGESSGVAVKWRSFHILFYHLVFSYYPPNVIHWISFSFLPVCLCHKNYISLTHEGRNDGLGCIFGGRSGPWWPVRQISKKFLPHNWIHIIGISHNKTPSQWRSTGREPVKLEAVC